MDNFWVVTLFHLQPAKEELQRIEQKAISDYEALGIEEYTLNEPEVDALLGERSYSGGDLPLEVLEEVEDHIAGKPGNYRFFFDNPDQARSFQSDVSQELLCETQIDQCPQEDWNAEWKKHYSPIKVNDQLEVIPSWMQDYNSETKKQIYIYPGMGFGTGSHETTFLCLKLYTEILSEKLTSVLDFGSGSGILGLASLLFSPEACVDFYDIDPEANKNCYHNAEINGLADKTFRLLLPEVREKLLPEYDFVFANILEGILLQEREALINHTKKNGHLILSGLLKHQVPTIIKAYSRPDLTLVKQLEKGDWAALLFEKGQ
jgi:ribosomal protein L11 methyltransferase